MRSSLIGQRNGEHVVMQSLLRRLNPRLQPIALPHATPKPVLDALFVVTADILRSAALQQKLDAQGLNVRIETPDVFGERIRRETAIWREPIRERNITAN
jgi:hypothetical protein